MKDKSITKVLEELEGGTFVGELTEALTAVVAAVMETSKAGNIKITLNVAPAGRSTVTLTGAFTTKEPEHTRDETTFFVTRDNELQRNDPAQIPLPLKVVPMGGATEPRNVDAAE